MSEEQSSLKDPKGYTGFIEKLVDGKFLILILSFIFYSDLFAMHNGIDPAKMPIQEAYEKGKSVSVFSIILFFLSYSILMAVFFPIVRRIIGILRFTLQTSFSPLTRSIEERRVSDWALAFISFSIIDGWLGFFSIVDGYRGLAVFILDFLRSDGVITIVFRLSVVVLWGFCCILSLEIDG